jgi:hypothetical protein
MIFYHQHWYDEILGLEQLPDDETIEVNDIKLQQIYIEINILSDLLLEQLHFDDYHH